MKYSLLVLGSCILTLVSSVPAQQDVVDQNSRFVMTLNDALISNLKSLGTLPSNLPAQAVGKIAAVHMQFSGASTEPATPVSAEVSVVGNACRISLTDDLIEMARQKPIRVDLPDDSQFASVFLDYAQSSSSSSSPNLGLGSTTQDMAPSDEPMDRAAVPMQHFVKLSSRNKTMAGILELSDSMKFDTKFGEVDIALAQISGIRFHIDGEDGAIVVLSNGDSITGVPRSNSFVLNTDWGRAEFDPVYVESITTNSRARFEQTNDASFGPRWELKGR